MKTLKMLVLLVVLPLEIRSVEGTEYSIKSADEFKDFADNVNSGTNYLGTTVLLDSDLSLSNVNEPIGFNSTKTFRGVFDGQGHVISDLKMTSSSNSIGLFGYSDNLTIRNVVLDSSCSMTNSYHEARSLSMGGIIGDCFTNNGQCYIENSVNMADITFDGLCRSGDSCIGGIIGKVYTYKYSSFSSYPISVKNCANYGSISHLVYSLSTYIGGISGFFYDSNSHYNFIHNCFNYGSIIHNGTTSLELYLGGIAGYTHYAGVENCVNAGKIYIQNAPSSKSYNGSIVGYVGANTTINYCYFTGDVGVSNLYGTGTPSNTSGTPNTTTFVNSSLINNLNGYATLNGWNKWLLNQNNNEISFTVNYGNTFTLSSQLILLQDLVSKEGINFSGWYSNSLCNETYQSTSVNEDMTLYGLYGLIVNVSFDFNGGTGMFTSKSVVFNSAYRELPDASREGYTFNGWFIFKNVVITNETIVTILYDHTLYAQWTINNYTLIFIFYNGTATEHILDFNTTIVYPECPKREGYTLKWNSTYEYMPAQDLTIVAQWTINNYTLMFDFGNGTIIKQVLGFNSSIVYPPDPDREGYTFEGWNKSDIKFMPAHDVTIVVLWTINNYTLTFDFCNRTIIKQVLNFNSSIVYPGNMNRKRHTFKGWSMNVAFMPAQDLTIMAIWEESKSIISLILAAEIVIPILLIVIIILIIMLVLMHKKSERKTNERDFDLYKSLIPPPKDSHPDGYSRVISVSKAEVESNISQNVSMNVLSRFYTKNYERPTLQDALTEVDLTEKHVKLICNACESAATIISDEGKLFNKFTKDDAAAIAMYTYDFGPGGYEKNPCRLINKNLIERSYAGLQKASGLLYLLMTALRKLPRATGKTLYRGVGREVNLSKGYYNKGSIITWPGLSSTSPDIVTTKALLAKGSTNGMAAGTLFIIENGWGYDIQPYSLFPDEEEILLEPEREFKVTGIIRAEGIIIINLQMQDTPLPLPDVFGSGIE